MKKKLGVVKLKIISGKANPSPPIGPALGQKGINIMEFCKKFNNETKFIDNVLLSVKIYFYSDKTFDFTYKKSTISFLIKDFIKSNNLIEKKIINYSDVLNIVKCKLIDLNTINLYSGFKTISGSIKSMGFLIKNID